MKGLLVQLGRHQALDTRPWSGSQALRLIAASPSPAVVVVLHTAFTGSLSLAQAWQG